MPNDRKRMFAVNGTGTVPKVKQRNNTTQQSHRDFQRNLSNNVDVSWDRYDYFNSARNFHHVNSYNMEAPVEDRRHNGVAHLNMPANGAPSTSSTSGSNSRRDSVGTIPKCDNVKKCPDKRQIEDKLNQIREYLRLTTSLMSSIKNEDQPAVKERESFEKMIKDLKDSEAKLLALLDNPIYSDETADTLPVTEPVENGFDNVSDAGVSGYQRNELENKVEFTNRKMQLLREQQNALINLKRKAENQLRDARQAQENLLVLQQLQQKGELEDKNETRFDSTIRDLEEKLRIMRGDPRRSASVARENLQSDDDFIHEQLDNSNQQLLQLMGNRDSQLNSEHVELQEKLTELQSKKMQIDQLAQQLQTLGDDDDEDIGVQVRKIVTMKQQLSSLKDLLEIVKNTECSLVENQNTCLNEAELQDNAHGMCAKTDNIRQDVRTHRNQNDNSTRSENNSARANEHWLVKESNKSLLKIQEREKLLAELKAKKQELEEIMYKQKDRTLINNDVCSETSMNKSEISTNNNMFDNVVMSWLPAQPNHNQIVSTYSSDEGAEEDISDINSAAAATVNSVPQPPPPMSSNFSTPSYAKRRPLQRREGSCQSDFQHHSSPRTSERCAPSSASQSFRRERTISNSGSELDKGQIQNQLELIQSVCQNLLDQQAVGNVHHLRNNLTPSPMYAEPRSYISLNPRLDSSVNSLNATVDVPYLNAQPVNTQSFGLGDVANNQNMLAANTLQTQAFLLNTLNQCCQMLWFQQREIASLRNMVCTLQEQMVNGQSEQQEFNAVPPPASSSFVFPTQRPVSSLSSFRAPSQPRNVNPKVNQVSAACSLPNLTPLIGASAAAVSTNGDASCTNQNNIRASPSARLLDSGLNNMHGLSEPTAANNVNVQPLPSQIWNGQALNNQVAPGNRANNYWDNFRSYSRQNLLSTSCKSNEVLQNTHASAAIPHDRSQSFSLLPPFSIPKLNMVHNESTNSSEESTPRRQALYKQSQNSNKPIAAVPPDVLNINHNVMGTQKTGDGLQDISLDLPEARWSDLLEDRTTEPPILKECSESSLNRNEWHDNEPTDTLPKSKLFEELRDNVYREVANLISANENRPHFLIQLFRDLQHINSDPLRGRTLQSIQTVITNSLSILESARGANRPGPDNRPNSDQEVVQVDSEYFSLQPSLWPQSPVSTSRNSSNMDLENDDPDIHNILQSIFTFLKLKSSDPIDQEQIDMLRNIILKATPFTQILINTNIQERTFHKHFSSVLNEAIEKFKGRRISEVRTDLLKAISEVLVSELTFIYLVQENIPENKCESSSATSTLTDNTLTLNLQPQQMMVKPEDGNTPQMQNGDLAEADQSRVEILEDEEGAVGGVLNILTDVVSSSTKNNEHMDPDLTDLAKVDFPISTEAEVEFAELGLDQVPTRLTTSSSRSHSNTPSRDRSNSRSDPMEHF